MISQSKLKRLKDCKQTTVSYSKGFGEFSAHLACRGPSSLIPKNVYNFPSFQGFYRKVSPSVHNYHLIGIILWVLIKAVAVFRGCSVSGNANLVFYHF